MRRPSKVAPAGFAGGIVLILLLSGLATPPYGTHAADVARALPGSVTTPSTTPSVGSGIGNSDWPMYMQNVGRNSANLNETTLSTTTARNISLLWTHHIRGAIQGSAVVVNGSIYLGTGTGNFSALNVSNGTQRWSTYIGQSVGCNATGGIASTATVHGGTVYVAGGDSYFYALNATTGAIEWKVFIGNTSAGYYNWGSPLFADGYLYYGTSSRCDQPLVPAALLQIDPVSHSVVRHFNTTQSGRLGASIWASPTINTTTNTVFIATGNSATITVNPPLSDQDSLIALNGSTLALQGLWTVPVVDRSPDGDFGATPSLVSGGGHSLVIALNKNGNLYAFNQSNVSLGPLWVDALAQGSQNGWNLATASFANGIIYQGAGQTNISGLPSTGSMYAIYAGNGTVKWVHAMPDHVFRAAAYANGLLVVEATKSLQILSASSGRPFFRANCAYPIQSDPTVAEDHIFVGCNGYLNAYGVGLSSGATAIPTSGSAPLQVAFSTTAHGGTPPYAYTWIFGDGTGAQAANTVHTFTTQGVYHATVWVNDSESNSSNQIFSIKVTAPTTNTSGGKGGSLLTKYRYAIIGAGVALVALIVLAVLYRRHRRRQQSPPPSEWTPPPIPPMTPTAVPSAARAPPPPPRPTAPRPPPPP